MTITSRVVIGKVLDGRVAFVPRREGDERGRRAYVDPSDLGRVPPVPQSA